MTQAKYHLTHLVRHLIHTTWSLSPAFYLAVAAIGATAIFSENIYLIEMLVFVLLYAQYAASWDILSGYTQQDNYGHAFFIGGAGYLSAMLNRYLDLSPWLSVPVSAGIAALVGVGIGWLTLRLRGPYFALSTIAFAAVLTKLAHIFSETTGGDEGLSGLDTFTDGVSSDIAVAIVLVVASVILLTAFANSHYGLILRSTQHNEDAAQASGINTAFYKILAFVVSGFFAGIGGAMYAHLNMQINPGMLSAQLSVLIVLLAIVGGRGTIIGPVLIAGAFTFFNEWLHVVELYRGVIFTGTLIILVYANPDGFANSRVFDHTPRLKYFLFGRKT
ncbi:MAG: branched-chain amino acid ABC transporter permease [Castellaniella sp.]